MAGFSDRLCRRLIVSAETVHAGAAPLWAFGMLVLLMWSLALATLLQTRFVKAYMPVLQRLCIQCLSVAAIFACLACYQGGIAPVPDLAFDLGVLWLTVLATFGGHGLYYLLPASIIARARQQRSIS